jgi:hypothetical protein
MLTVDNNTVAQPGQTLYGLVVEQTATSLTLVNVDINVASGGKGPDGPPGTNSQLVTSTSPANGNAGSPAGSNGIAGNSTYAPSGFVSGQAQNGTAGGNGNNGGPAPPPPCVNHVTCRLISSSCQPYTTQTCGGAGTFGIGTTGAGGGTGGYGGGASIGIFVAAPAGMSVTGGSITTGNGGAGGTGGGAGSQLPATMGQPGLPSYTVCEMDTNCGTPPSCVETCATQGVAAGGAAGGHGGEGAAGGQGGGGAGGDSHCYATYGTASVTFNPGSCTTGSLGAGGAPNGPPGSNSVHN